MTTWILLNTEAGSGHIPVEIIRLLKSKLSLKNTNVIMGAFGRYRPSDLPNEFLYRSSIKDLFGHLSSIYIPDLVIAIGGDGTMNMIANAIINQKWDVPLMGIGVGTGNVGPLVRFNLRKLKDLDFSALQFEYLSAIEVFKKEQLGYAFVDVVIAPTFLGTFEGKRVDFDAVEVLKSGELKVVRRSERRIAEKAFEIKLNSKTIFKGNRGVKQIAVAPLYKSEFYVGKAATGILCYAHHTNRRAVIVLSDHPTIVARPKRPEKAVTVRQIPFGENDTIVMKGLAPNNAVILDGNPVALVDEKELTFKYRENIIKTVIPPDGSFLPLAVHQ
ncbi:MAG: hypothetical protein PWP37_1510 [Thermotogota bacterium]|nr:hypothetical protein [Thermotogota bacterium]MDK2865318.1 hypothetical protein [Thermotogota bacterium]HCZ05872.1 hypothetical protein [Thermotogota bacterium]